MALTCLAWLRRYERFKRGHGVKRSAYTEVVGDTSIEQMKIFAVVVEVTIELGDLTRPRRVEVDVLPRVLRPGRPRIGRLARGVVRVVLQNHLRQCDPEIR